MSNNYFNSTGTIGFTCDVCGRELQSCTWMNGMRFCAKCYQETFGASKDWQLLDKDKTIAEQRKQIADLEAKLAESEKQRQHLKDWLDDEILTSVDHESYNATINEYEEELAELKQQLAEKEKEKEKEIESLKVDGVLYEELEAKDDTIIKPFLKEKLTIEEFKHIIKNLSDFNLRQTSFHDIQKNDVIFNAYINKHIAYKKCSDLLDLVDQDKISFAVEQLEKVKEFCDNPKYQVEYEYYTDCWTAAIDKDSLLNEIDNQIEELKRR